MNLNHMTIEFELAISMLMDGLAAQIKTRYLCLVFIVLLIRVMLMSIRFVLSLGLEYLEVQLGLDL